MKKEKLTFVATQVLNKPIKISFYTKEGKRVYFDAVETREKIKRLIGNKIFKKSAKK